MAIKDTYVDGVINQSANRFPKYNLYDEHGAPWGIMELQNITDYSVVGSTFGAEDANALANGYCRIDPNAATGSIDAIINEVIAKHNWSDCYVEEGVLDVKALFSHVLPIIEKAKREYVQLITTDDSGTVGTGWYNVFATTASTAKQLGNSFIVNNGVITTTSEVATVKIDFSAAVLATSLTQSYSAPMLTFAVRVNGTDIYSAIDGASNTAINLSRTGYILDVYEGDTIELYAHASTGNLLKVLSGANFTIEAIEYTD